MDQMPALSSPPTTPKPPPPALCSDTPNTPPGPKESAPLYSEVSIDKKDAAGLEYFAGRSSRQADTSRASKPSENNAVLATDFPFDSPLTPPATPDRDPVVLGDDEKQPDEDMDVAKLRDLLKLTTGECGARKKDGGACKRKPSKYQIPRVNNLLEETLKLWHSSQEFHDILDKLAEQVHCYQHKVGTSQEARREGWKAVLNREEREEPDVATQMQNRIRETLRLKSTECIAIDVSTGEMCRSGIGGQKVQNCIRTIEHIVKPQIYLNDKILVLLLELLESEMSCHQHKHQDGQPFEKVDAWKSGILNIRKEQQATQDEIRTSDSTPTPAPDTNVESALVKAITDNLVPPNGLGSLMLTRESGGRLRLYWPTAYDVSLFKVFRPRERPAYLSSYALNKEMKRELTGQDLQNGYVYVYEVEGNQGLVKIGYTARSVEERHKEWEFDCNRVPKSVYPFAATPTKVPMARRIEALCHKELDHCRVKIYCEACMKDHTEWFEISADKAISIVRKWSIWMATDPYQTRTLRNGDKASLKAEVMREIRDMDSFMNKMSKLGLDDEEGSSRADA